MFENVAEIDLKRKFLALNREYLKKGLTLNELKQVVKKQRKYPIFTFSSILIPILIVLILRQCNKSGVISYLRGVRCIIPNNYFVWEATRQISDCSFCNNVNHPIILKNLTREQFAPYAYSSKPIIVKNAFSHWPAMTIFDFDFFKNLYENNEEAYKSVDEECQFLHFKSDFTSLRDVFKMNSERVANKNGEKSWYVGWGNCHPDILRKMREYYPKPHFLPEDCEMPSKEYVFMGYEDGATMHLDFINRLMWQAQLKGTKTWFIRPAPECEEFCSQISFDVEPGDAVLLDTRIWYHGTKIKDGQFSLSIQSEYG